MFSTSLLKGSAVSDSAKSAAVEEDIQGLQQNHQHEYVIFYATGQYKQHILYKDSKQGVQKQLFLGTVTAACATWTGAAACVECRRVSPVSRTQPTSPPGRSRPSASRAASPVLFTHVHTLLWEVSRIRKQPHNKHSTDTW